MSKQHDLIVIGAGPGGYVAAIRAAQLGLDVACVDEHEALGGTCLRVGCIPSKAMLESSERYEETRNGLKAHGVKASGVELDLKTMLQRKDRVVTTLTKGVASLFKKNKITTYTARARFTAARTLTLDDQDGTQLQAERILIATGSRPATLPGVEFDGDRIVSSSGALSFDRVPEHLVVIGAGYIGLELGSVWRRLGAKVTVLEYLDRVLPGSDTEIADEAQKILKKQGLDIHLGTKVTGASVRKNKVTVESEGNDAIQCDRVLIAVGRRPNTDDLGLDAIGVEPDEKCFIQVDERFATAAEGVYAIGDVIGGLMLAHKAEDEGVACAEWLASGHGHIDYDSIPSVVYTHPEIAAVGRHEQQLKDAGVEYRVGKFPFTANGRARTLNQTTGWIKVLADAETDRVLGVHMIGPRAGDLIAEAAVAMAYGASSEDIARACHAHPTLAETLKEAALAVDDRTIHM